MHEEVTKLKQKIKSATGKEKVNILNKLCKIHKEFAPETALNFAQEALVLAQKIGYKKGESYALNRIGNVHFKKSNYEVALKYQLLSLEINKEIGNPKGIGSNYVNMGNNYAVRDDYTKALDYYLKGLEIFEEIGDKEFIGNAYGNIGNIYQSIGQDHKALEYHLKCLNSRQELGNRKLLGVAYINAGNAYKEIGDYQKGVEYYFEGAKIHEEFGEFHGLAICYLNIGNFYRTEKDYNSALEFYQKSSEANKKIGDKRVFATIYNNMGKMYILLEKYDLAEDCYSKGLELASMIKVKLIELSSYGGLAELFELQKNCSKALEYHKKYSALKQEIFNKERSKQIAEMQTKYETEKKELENLRLKEIVEYQKRELFNLLRNSEQKNEFIQKLKEQLQQARIQTEQKIIIDYLKQTQQEDWNSFYERFQQIYPGFIEKLTHRNSALTRRELKICALIKLKFSTKQIAKTLYIAERTVKNHRNHIRKKLQIPAKEDINCYFDTIDTPFKY